jgi:hypothetical protein
VKYDVLVLIINENSAVAKDAMVFRSFLRSHAKSDTSVIVVSASNSINLVVAGIQASSLSSLPPFTNHSTKYGFNEVINWITEAECTREADGKTANSTAVFADFDFEKYHSLYKSLKTSKLITVLDNAPARQVQTSNIYTANQHSGEMSASPMTTSSRFEKGKRLRWMEQGSAEKSGVSAIKDAVKNNVMDFANAFKRKLNTTQTLLTPLLKVARHDVWVVYWDYKLGKAQEFEIFNPSVKWDAKVTLSEQQVSIRVGDYNLSANRAGGRYVGTERGPYGESEFFVFRISAQGCNGDGDVLKMPKGKSPYFIEVSPFNIGNPYVDGYYGEESLLFDPTSKWRATIITRDDYKKDFAGICIDVDTDAHYVLNLNRMRDIDPPVYKGIESPSNDEFAAVIVKRFW